MKEETLLILRQTRQCLCKEVRNERRQSRRSIRGCRVIVCTRSKRKHTHTPSGEILQEYDVPKAAWAAVGSVCDRCWAKSVSPVRVCFRSLVPSSLNQANERQANKLSFRTMPRETVVLFFPENDKIIHTCAKLPEMIFYFIFLAPKNVAAKLL